MEAGPELGTHRQTASPDPGPVTLTARQRRRLLTLAVAGITLPVVVTFVVLVVNGAPSVTMKQFWFLTHLGFGVVIVHGFAGGLAALLVRGTTRLKEAARLVSTASLAVVSWLAVLTGTWLVYPMYREVPPEGADLRAYPKHYLLEGDLWLWHAFGMEWKEGLGWLTPMLATAVAYVAYRHGDLVNRDQRVRVVTVAFFTVAFLAAAVAAGLGALVNTVAPNDFLRS